MITYKDIRDKTPQERISIAAQLRENDNLADCERVLSFILDDDPYCITSLSMMGCIYLEQDRYGMAETMFRAGIAVALQRGETHKNLYLGLGTAIRSPERIDECLMYLNHVLEIDPNNTAALTNIASMYVESCQYEKGVEYARKSLAISGDSDKSYAARDALALANLGLENFEEGFKLNAGSLGRKFRKEVQFGNEDRWDGTPGKTVIIYGEQGLGDEIFYGSAIPDAIKDCKQVIIDCDPRLEGLFKRSFSGAFVYGTRAKAASWLHSHQWDARCAMADLSVFYRKSKESFTGESFLKADPVRTSQWKRTLGKKGKIGIAFRGGNKFTNRSTRTIPLEVFRPLIQHGDLYSLEYAPFDYGDFPIQDYTWVNMSEDYDNLAAFVSAMDFIVTTCTAVVHLAGALGVPCYVLRNKYYSWRYAHDMPWYSSVEVIKCDGDWEAGMNEVLRRIGQRQVA